MVKNYPRLESQPIWPFIFRVAKARTCKNLFIMFMLNKFNMYLHINMIKMCDKISSKIEAKELIPYISCSVPVVGMSLEAALSMGTQQNH